MVIILLPSQTKQCIGNPKIQLNRRPECKNNVNIHVGNVCRKCMFPNYYDLSMFLRKHDIYSFKDVIQKEIELRLKEFEQDSYFMYQ